MLALAAGLLLQAYRPLHFLPLGGRGPAVGVGSSLIAAALVWMIAAERSLRSAGTPLEPWKPTTALVTSGPYALSRNPLYLGLTAAFVGVALVLGNGWLLVALPPLATVMVLGVVRREERYLQSLFGECYARYRRSVRRWL
jgi:protein-S-isoprenylcysteine O-methyltransferase Ste14